MSKKIIITILAASLIILVGGVALLSKTTTPTITASLNAKAFAEEKTYDWGVIKYNDPKATKIFKIKNTGTDILKLSNIKTSCSCTSAQVKTDQGKSPLFGMHGTSSWVGEVEPGGQAELEVVFDQRFHGPTGVGPVTRIITAQTNDANSPKLEFTLTGTVVR